jgi:hypothetical protein
VGETTRSGNLLVLSCAQKEQLLLELEFVGVGVDKGLLKAEVEKTVVATHDPIGGEYGIGGE